MEVAQQEKTPAPLLRQDQVDEMEGDVASAKAKLSSPHYQGDRGMVAEQLRSLERQLETQRPRPFRSEEIDAVVREEKELREQISIGMLSQEEMRKSPPGAVDRHRAWERKNLSAILRWQNIQRRLNAGSGDHESASIERFRPTLSTMNMDNALIPGKNIFLPPVGAATPVTFTTEQLAALEALAPGLRAKLAILDNVQRAEVKAVLEQPREKHWKDMNAAERKAHRAKKAA